MYLLTLRCNVKSVLCETVLWGDSLYSSFYSFLFFIRRFDKISSLENRTFKSATHPEKFPMTHLVRSHSQTSVATYIFDPSFVIIYVHMQHQMHSPFRSSINTVHQVKTLAPLFLSFRSSARAPTHTYLFNPLNYFMYF